MSDVEAEQHYIDMLLGRWRKISEEIRSLEEQRTTLSELILARPEMRSGVRRCGVRVVRTVAFSAKRARNILTDADYDAICETKPTARLAKEHLPDEVYQLLRVELPKKHLRMSSDGDDVAD